MARLLKSIEAWGTPVFENVLKHELEQLDVSTLPLQQGLEHSSYAVESGIQAMIISVREESGYLRVKSGIFYTGIIPGCSCADDPTPSSDYPEYCELQFEISKTSGEVKATLLAE